MKISKYIFATIIFVLTNIICYSQKDSTIKTDTLKLRSGWAWLSFPRLDREGNDVVSVNEALLGKIDPDYDEFSELQNKHTDILTNSIYGTSGWSGDLINVKSSFGYKLHLEYETQPEQIWLSMMGTSLNPDVDVELIADYENWAGYWLPESQSPFDAIPESVLDELISIKAQYWSCIRQCVYTPDGTAYSSWICGILQGSAKLKYGDMVILVKEGEEDTYFKWQRYGNPPQGEQISPTENFNYTEQADYTSFFVELDTTENPQELGAFIGDTCIGATTVLPEDTTVLVPGYMEGMSGEVTFQQYYSMKATPTVLGNYHVKNNMTGIWEKRSIKTGEKQDYYMISLKKEKKNYDIPVQEVAINCYPNPASSECIVEYSVQTEQYIRIVVYDIYGNTVNVLQEGNSRSGNFSMKWNTADSKGNGLHAGIYIIKIETKDFYAQTKIIIIK